jgi:hypothetical protein
LVPSGNRYAGQELPGKQGAAGTGADVTRCSLSGTVAVDQRAKRCHTIDFSGGHFEAISPVLVGDARRIVDAVMARGVSLRGGFGSGEPVVTTERVEVRARALSMPVRVRSTVRSRPGVARPRAYGSPASAT